MNLQHLCLLLLVLSTCSSCARLGYLVEQGLGQWRIQRQARDNSEVLKDPKIPKEHKDKILIVEDAKKFFHHYFARKSTGIYSKTTYLDEVAVSWLVVASKPTEVKAVEFEFPFAGSFPYIGFFKRSSAQEYREDLEKEGLVAWIRPVYAYSTLGYLEDRILSSFFYYDEVELVELTFHELFHTVFFVKDEVDLNENLASYFSNILLDVYFKGRESLLEIHRKRVASDKVWRQEMLTMIADLKSEFAKLGSHLNDEKAVQLTQRFVDEIWKPRLQQICEEYGRKAQDCRPLREEWNQASFAHMLTYEEEQDFLEKLWKSYGQNNPKNFLEFIEQKYISFEKSHPKDLSFTDMLKQEATL